MSLSIQELDAMWNKYYAEYNRTPNSHHQLMAFAKATGTPLKFLDARKYFDMRKDDKMKPQHPSSQTKSSTKQSRAKFSRNNKKSKKKKDKKHRRNSSLPLIDNSPNIGLLSASNKYKKNEKKKAHKKHTKHTKHKKTDKKDKKKRKIKVEKKKKRSKDSKKKKNIIIKEANPTPKAKKMDPNAWIKNKNESAPSAVPAPKKKVVQENAWVKPSSSSQTQGNNNNIKISAIKPKKNIIDPRPTSPKKKIIHSWVKDPNPNQVDANIKPKQIQAPPKKIVHSWGKDTDSIHSNRPISAEISSASSAQKKVIFPFGKAPNVYQTDTNVAILSEEKLEQQKPVSNIQISSEFEQKSEQKSVPVSNIEISSKPVSNIENSSKLVSKFNRPNYAVPTPPGKTRAKVGVKSFKNHTTSPNINDVNNMKPNINEVNNMNNIKSSKKKKVVFNDNDDQKSNDKTTKKKTKAARYLSFFGRKKSKKKAKAEFEVTSSPEISASDLATPMKATRSLSISQSDTENVNDDNCKAGHTDVPLSLKKVQSDNAPTVQAPIVHRNAPPTKRSGSVFSRIRSSSKGDDAVRRELEQLKKIRKQELRQLNNLKKEQKTLRDKFNKVTKEKKNQAVQIKQLKDTVKRKEGELNDIQKDLEHMRKNNGELIHKFNDSETKNKKLDNTLTAKNNEVRILRNDGKEYKRQIIQLMDLQSQSDKKIFSSLQTQNETLQEEVYRYRQEIEELNNKQIDYDNLTNENAKLNKDKDETKKKYLYFKDKLDKMTHDKNDFESNYLKEVENKVFLETELTDLQTQFEKLQRKHFELRKTMETELNVLREQQELDKEMDQNIIAEQQRKLAQFENTKNRTQTMGSVVNPVNIRGSIANNTMTNQQNWEHQQRMYQQEQYRRQQQWMAYQQQQQQQQIYNVNPQLNETLTFPPPPPGPPPEDGDNNNGDPEEISLPNMDENPEMNRGQYSEYSAAGSVIINEDAKTTKTYYEDGTDSQYESNDSDEVDDEYSGDSEDETDSEEDSSEYSGDTEDEDEEESESEVNDEIVNTVYDNLNLYKK